MDKGFYKGFEVELVGRRHIKLLKNLSTAATDMKVGEEYFVEHNSVEPLVSEAFGIGDKVMRVGGTFIGTVTGFELNLNRAICVSEKIENYSDQRTRYAYAVSELKKFEPNFVFEIGSLYVVNGSVNVMAIESMFNKNEVMLFSSVTGKMLYRDVAIHNTLPNLETTKNIVSIEKV